MIKEKLILLASFLLVANPADPAQLGTPATEPPVTETTAPPTEQQPPAAEQPAVVNQKEAIEIPGKINQPAQKPPIIKIRLVSVPWRPRPRAA
jgi:hypothetical protein